AGHEPGGPLPGAGLGRARRPRRGRRLVPPLGRGRLFPRPLQPRQRAGAPGPYGGSGRPVRRRLRRGAARQPPDHGLGPFKGARPGPLGARRALAEGGLTMILPIPMLDPEEVAHCRALLDAADWIDGKATAGAQSARAKSNLQLAEDTPAARALGDLILRRLGRNPTFLAAALPLRVTPPLFNR